MGESERASAGKSAAAPSVGGGRWQPSVVNVAGLLLLIVGLFQLGSGIVSAIVPIKLANSGFAPSVLGWVSTSFSVGFLGGCVGAAHMIGRLGVGHAMTAFAMLNCAATLLLLASQSPEAWALSRAVSGFAVASLLVLVEAWLGSAATAATRGRIFGFYMVLSRLAFTLGQVALALVDPASAGLLAAAAIAYALSPWPGYSIPGPPPVIGRKSGPDLRDLPFTVPAAAAAALVHGLIGTTGPALLPLYALARGLTVDQVALLLATIPLGGLLFQIPFSHLSDRFGRRTMMAAAAIATMALSALYLMPTLPTFGWLMLLTTLWGGAPAALYILAVAHANDIATDAQRVGWSSTLLLLWGIGAALGPLAASMLMEWFGYDALFWFTGGLGAGLGLFLLLRKLLRKRGAYRAPAGDTIGPAPGVSG